MDEAEKPNNSPSAKVRTITIRFSKDPEEQALYQALVKTAGYETRGNPPAPHRQAKWLLYVGLGFRRPDQAVLDRMRDGNEWRKRVEKRHKAASERYERSIADRQPAKSEPATPQPTKPTLRLV